MTSRVQDQFAQRRSIKLATLFTIVSATSVGCTEIDNGWSPGAAPEDGWTVPALYQRAVENGFSGSVLVRYRGEMLLNSAAGLADREAGIPNVTGTVHAVGSITKQHTGALILSLQQSGLLNVADHLSAHFSGVTEDKATITLHQLLTHTAGFPSGLGCDYDRISREEYLDLAWSAPLEASPGAEFSYSNVGYSIAAAIAERASGQSYEVALRERVLMQADMAETGYVLPDWTNRSIAIGYGQGGSLALYWNGLSIAATRTERDSSATSEAPWAEDGPYWNLRGNGGLLTTTNDLLNWHDALSGVAVLDTSGVEALQGRHVDSSGEGSEFYGYGIWTADSPVGPLHWHGGANGYNYAQMLRFIDEDLVVIMLANEDSPVARYLPMGLARAASRSLVNWRSPFDR